MSNNNNKGSNKSKIATNNKKNRNKRNFQSNSRSKSAKSQAAEEIQDAMNGTNDVAWYVNNEQMLKDVASIPFSRRAGTPLTMQLRDMEGRNVAIGGVAALEYMPVIGSDVDGVASPVNIAMKAVYSYVRHANSGSKVYDAPDLMLYLLAMDSAYALWSWCVRLIGVSQLYNMQNAHYPKTIAEAMRVSDEMLSDIQANMSNFRTKVNQFAIRLNSFAVPTKFTTYVRHMWLNQNIFLDGTDPKSQVYVFNPAGFYRYDESKAPASLTTVPRPNTYLGTVQLLDDILDALFSSEDIGIMSGDILKAYGAANLFALGSIDENYVTQPVYDENILMQIENCTICGDFALSNYAIVQDGSRGYLQQKGTTVSNKTMGDHILNFHSTSPTPADVMEATRLTVAGKSPHSVFTGSEVVQKVTIWYGTVGNLKRYDLVQNVTVNGDETAYIPTAALMVASNFKRFPLIIEDPGKVVTNGFATVLGDLENYTVVSVDQLRNLHTAALMGMYGIPYVLTQN